jgi:acetyl esterase/lipase
MPHRIVAALTAALFLTVAASASAAPAHQWDVPPKPRGVIITIHGGGWIHTGPDLLAMEDGPVSLYRKAGWATLNIDYRPGRASITDVVRFYDQARRRFGRHTPICASGQSAGGHLAMLLAVERPRLACVISEEGPALLAPIAAGASSPETAKAARDVWGSELAKMSPALRLKSYRGRVLASYSPADTIVPGAVQARALRASGADVTLVRIPAGSVPWVHFSADTDALDEWRRAQLALLHSV